MHETSKKIKMMRFYKQIELISKIFYFLSVYLHNVGRFLYSIKKAAVIIPRKGICKESGRVYTLLIMFYGCTCTCFVFLCVFVLLFFGWDGYPCTKILSCFFYLLVLRFRQKFILNHCDIGFLWCVWVFSMIGSSVWFYSFLAFQWYIICCK